MINIKTIRGFSSLSKKSFALISAVVLVLVLVATSVSRVFAIGNFYLSASASSVTVGGEVTVTVRINPGTSVAGVESSLNYDQSKLEFVSFNDAGSTFPFTLEQIGGGGKASSVRTFLPPANTSTDSLVTRVVFKAVGAGSASLSVTGNASDVDPEKGWTNPAGGSLTVTVKNPTTPTPDPDPTPNPNPDPDPNPNPDPAPSDPSKPNNKPSPGVPPAKPTPKDAPGAVSASIESSNIQFNKADIVIKTDKEAKLYVKFGMTSDSLNQQTAQTELGTTHKISFDETQLFPGTTYYYQVIAENPEGTQSISEVQSFKTKGFTLKVSAQDKNGRPLKGKKLTLHSDPVDAETNGDGIAEFADVAPGQHTLEYVDGDKKYEKTIIVEDVATVSGDGSQVAGVQNVSIIFDELEQSRFSTASKVGLIVALVVIGAFIILVILKRGLVTEAVSSVGSHIGGGPSGSAGAGTSGTSTPSGASGADSGHAEPSSTESHEPKVFQVGMPKQHDPGAVVNPTATNTETEDKDQNGSV